MTIKEFSNILYEYVGTICDETEKCINCKFYKQCPQALMESDDFPSYVQIISALEDFEKELSHFNV